MVIKIECDRRIRKLNIEFDSINEGECEIVYDEPRQADHPTKGVGNVQKNSKQTSHKAKKEEFLSLDEDYSGTLSTELVEKPIIEDKEREPAVAKEMQNLEF